MEIEKLKLIIELSNSSDYCHIYLGENHIFCSKNKKDILDRIAGFLYFRDGQKRKEESSQ